jgi:DnaJ-class molecular chaperone
MKEDECIECEGTGYYTYGPNEIKCPECKGSGMSYDPWQRDEYIPERDYERIPKCY